MEHKTLSEHPWTSMLIEKNTFLDFAEDKISVGGQSPRFLRRNSAPMCFGGEALERSSASSERLHSTIASQTESTYLQEDESEGKRLSGHSENRLVRCGQEAQVNVVPRDSPQHNVAPSIRPYAELEAEIFMRQAKELSMKAKELEAQAWRLRNLQSTDSSEANVEDVSNDSSWTTVMLRNIPNNITRAGLLALFERSGFPTKCFDFCYLPIDFKRDANLGYAFVNLVSTQEADRFFQVFHGFGSWGLASEKVGAVCWGQPLQGLDQHIERYRNSPVMHSAVPEDHKPMLFHDGKRIPFPEPTKKVRKLRAPYGPARK
jgi:hypothetical protein|eukprot:CAMPEP_0169135590 /NCGR_PEP_ID=MMETSP1015-20121227/40527_1 /TAXON_ID=342587 /ORGANISM="Karlodinium micrum, Strain CCMP2283" /LENGTH=317 /DNA_ID=CAMNT_0009200259 /DNA_START=45 /DNA_END=998 /DNA_ORIENTATION=-